MMRASTWRVLVAAVVSLVVVSLVACTSAATPIGGQTSGAQSVALVSDGGFLFVTSTDTNDLRVLLLTVPNSDARTFVAAPNPLEPLQIPTLDRPTTLVLDESWEGGTRRSGNYLFAIRRGGAEVSIVGAQPNEFREVRRLITPAPVTAIGGVRLSDATSRLYFTTFDGAAGALFSLDLPAEPNALRAIARSTLIASIKRVTSFPDNSVNGLVVVPALASRTASATLGIPQTPFCNASECVVLALRPVNGGASHALMIEPGTLRTVPLAFDAEVRSFALMGSTSFLRNGVPVSLEAGERIFALLDEERCVTPPCSGLLAVDTRSAPDQRGFERAIDLSEKPMIPIRFGNGLPIAVTAVAGGSVLVPGALSSTGDAGVALFPALGVVTSGNGEVIFFDAAELHHLDLDSEPARLGNARYVGVDGGVQPYFAGPIAVQSDGGVAQVDGGSAALPAASVSNGALESQQLFVVWQGIVSGGLLPTTDAAQTTLAIDNGTTGRFQVGDIVVFQRADGTTCADTTVQSIGSTSIEVASVDGCSNKIGFVVRAASTRPMTLVGSFNGYLGRAGPGEQFVYSGPYVAHQPGVTLSAPLLSVWMGFDTNTQVPERDTYWLLDLDARLAPLSVLADAATVGCNTNTPGQPVFDLARQRVFIAFPSASAVIDINPALVTRGLIQPPVARCYR